MFKRLKGIYYFQLKLFVPSISVALIFGSFGYFNGGAFSLRILGTAYLMFSLLMHFFIYEMSYKKEYYFYHNLGLSRLALWLSTLILGLIIKFSMMSI